MTFYRDPSFQGQLLWMLPHLMIFQISHVLEIRSTPLTRPIGLWRNPPFAFFLVQGNNLYHFLGIKLDSFNPYFAGYNKHKGAKKM